MSQRPVNFAWPYLNPASPLYKGLVFAGLGPHPGGRDYHDCSPYRNHGTLTGIDIPATATSGWGWDTTLGRPVMEFDGSNDYVNLVNTPSIKPPIPLAISLWVNPNAVNVFQIIICTDGWDINLYRGLILQITSTGKANLQIGNGAGGGTSPYRSTLTSSASCTTGWQHITGVIYAYNSMKLFRNGVDMGGTMSGTATTLGYSVEIGRIGQGADGNQKFAGSVSDPMLFNRAIALPQIQALADPSNALLRVGGVSLIQEPRRVLWRVAPVGGPNIAAAAQYYRRMRCA